MPPNIGHTPIIGFPISGGNICYIPPYFGEIKFILPPNIVTPPIWNSPLPVKKSKASMFG